MYYYVCLANPYGPGIALNHSHSSMKKLRLTKTKFSYKVSIFLGVTFLLSLLVTSSVKAAPFAGGTGTAADPYQITTPQEMDSVSHYPDACFKLMNNLDLTVDYPNWIPLGEDSDPFRGTFDGNGHIIKYKITSAAHEYVGLFGVIIGTVRNLGVAVDMSVSVDYAGGLVGGNAGHVTHCFSFGVINNASRYGAGGLVGANINFIDSCYSTCRITGMASGGLVGFNSTNSLVGKNGVIRECYSTGNITGDNETGGLVGYNTSVISNCYSTGQVVGSSTQGGLVAQNDGTIDLCYYNIATSHQGVGIGTTLGSGSGSAPGITTAQMKKKATFAGWDFIKAWQINENSTYPALQNIDNAPFAFGDSLKGQSIALTQLLANDYDFETGQAKLVYKVVQLYGTGTVRSGNYIFPSGSSEGFKDSLLYQVGEVATAKDTVWGNVAKALMIKGFSGSGTIASPYLIYTPMDMDSVRNRMNSCYKLMANLDLTADYPNWTPLGDINKFFDGKFDGNGHVVKYKISSIPPATNGIGLFGYSAGKIKNLGVDADISVTNDWVGGLVGFMIYDTIVSCYSTGRITGQYKVGGLVGYIQSGGTHVINSYSTAEVSGFQHMGGLIGSNEGVIDSCYSTGKVTGDWNRGGLVGTNYATIVSGFYDKTTSGQSAGIGIDYSSGTASVIGKTTGDMKKQTTFPDWNFTKTWQINEGHTYPVLKNMDNAPFAFRDTLASADSVNLSLLKLNDYDYETGQSMLVCKLLKVHGSGSVKAGYYRFPAGSLAGFSDTLDYRIGEKYSATDTLWGNNTVAVFTLSPTLSATPANIQLRAANNSSSAIQVKSNTNWNVTSSEPWLVPSVTSGTGKGSVTVTAAVNNTGLQRTATVTFSATGTSDVPITITQAAKQPLTISIAAQDKVYNGTTTAVVTIHDVNGIAQGDNVTAQVTNGKFDTKNTGNGKTVTADVAISGTEAGNYTCNSSASTTANITAAPLTINITSQDKVYDGNANAAVTTSMSGLIADDIVTANASNAHFDNKNKGTGKTVNADITLSGTDAGNYTCNATAVTTANIMQAALTINFFVQDKVYDGNTNAVISSTSIISGLVNGEDVKVVATNGRFDNKNVGSNKTVYADISLSGADAGNYASWDKAASSLANITPATLSVNLTAYNKAYDSNTKADFSSVSITGGLITGEDVVATATGNFDTKNVGIGKTVNAEISLSGADAGNYRVDTYTTTANITKADLAGNISVSPDQNKYKGGTQVTFTVTYPVTIDISEGAPDITFNGAGMNLSIPLVSTDRITWTYQLTAPATGNGTVTIGAALKDTDGNFNQSVTGKTSVILENTPDGIHTFAVNDPIIAVYPTINNGTFKIDLANPETGKVSVRIINIQGITVKEFRFNKSLKTATLDAFIDSPATGFYMVEVNMGGYRSIQKIKVE